MACGAANAGVLRYSGRLLAPSKLVARPVVNTETDKELFVGNDFPVRHLAPQGVSIPNMVVYSAISFRPFSGRTLTRVRAGLALNTVCSPVKGLIPFHARVAGFLTVFIFIRPGRVNSPAPRFFR